MIFHVWSHGDPSVGIPGNSAEVDISSEEDFDPEDRKEYIDTIKKCLRDAFSEIWGEPVHIASDEELEAENETLLAEIERLKYCFGVLFIDSLGAKRKSVDECRGKVEYVEIGGTIYWPLSERDKERLIAASCGNGIFDGPSKAPPQEVDR
jgi:hypothetical protein